MDDPFERQEVVNALAGSAGAIATLAANDAAFRAAVAAFRASDAPSFQKALAAVNLKNCELICFWLRSKECVLVCLELCGLPKQPITIDAIPKLYDLIARLAGEPAALERLATIVAKRDAQAWTQLVKELKAEAFCHLLCHWVCMVHWRLACRIVCSPTRIPIQDFASELRTAAVAISRAFKDSARLRQVVDAAIALRCETLSELFVGDGGCFLLCEWICSWRCVLVCLPLCRTFTEPVVPSVDEMLAFARALAPLAGKPDAIRSLMEAVLAQDAETYARLVKQWKLERFCLQLCHWICFAICRRFCICVCPPAPTIPLFTHVGAYKITTDFTVNGTTTAGDLAFTGTIPLIGILPDGTAPDPLEYHFRIEKYPLGGGPSDVTAAMIPATRIGELEYKEWDGVSSWFTSSADYWVNNPGAAVSINQQFGPPLVVPVNKDVKPGGWIEVPTENNLVNGGVGRFIPNTGIMANLDTTQLTDENFDLSIAVPPLPLRAGDGVPLPQQSAKPHYKIYFEARKILGAVPVGANNLDKIALSNTHYTYVRHPNWAGGLHTDILVLSLDVEELLVVGCKPLSTDVHALFTAYHPYLGTCKVYIEGPPVPPLPPPVFPAISALGQALSPSGGQDFNIAAQKPCAYIVWIEATLRLTSGYGGLYGTFSDHVAFCKR